MKESTTLTLILVGVVLLLIADIYAYKEASAASATITAATTGVSGVIAVLESIV